MEQTYKQWNKDSCFHLFGKKQYESFVISHEQLFLLWHKRFKRRSSIRAVPWSFETKWIPARTYNWGGLPSYQSSLILSWRRSLTYRNQSCKSMDLFLYGRDLRLERIQTFLIRQLWSFFKREIKRQRDLEYFNSFL